jgi:hypothetical protein
VQPMAEDRDSAVAVVAHPDDLEYGAASAIARWTGQGKKVTYLDTGVASLRAHKAYLEGLGREFDPDQFLRDMAAFARLGAGCEYAVTARRYTTG